VYVARSHGLWSLAACARSGAEEKFPVFVFVVIKAKVSDLHAHADMLSDFLPQQTITKTGTS
jgi:hypothetical protein